MKKVGIAFSDYLIKDRITYKKKFESVDTLKIVSIIPIFLLFLVISALILRTFYLQVLRGAYFRDLSNNNKTREKVIPSPRGIIFDRNGNALVRNVAVDKKGDQVLREYLYKDIFAHVIGYVGAIDEKQVLMHEYKGYSPSDLIGKMGLEQSYENILKGVNGRQLYEVNATGEEIRALGADEPLSGESIKTTLSLTLQKAIDEAFSDVKKGAAVVSDPSNGAILALYSKPTFDANLFTHKNKYRAQGNYKSIDTLLSDQGNQPFLNRAIGGLYPPGSTFKLIVAAQALNAQKIDKETKIEDTGVINVGEFSYSNWYFTQYGRKEGEINVIDAIKRSNDIFFYRTGELLGVDEMANGARDFGLGKKLGIDIMGERSGIVPDEKWKQKTVNDQWYLGDTYHYGIGQGYILTTPLQVNFLTSVFANDGTLYKPHIIQGRTEVIKRNFVKKENLEIVREGMRKSCETGGVAWPLFNFKVKNDNIQIDGKDYIEAASGGAKFVDVSMGCKTGTAETTKDQDPHAWITLFTPFYKPEIVLTVLVENGGEGSNVAGPIAKKILEKYFENK